MARAALLASSALVTIAQPSAAQDATWLLDPTVAGSGAGTFALGANANWSTGTVPTGATAFFGATNGANLTMGSGSFGGWTLNPDAADYMIAKAGGFLDFTGAGIAVNGGSVSIVQVGGFISFRANSSAGSASIAQIGFTEFFDNSTAGNASLTNNVGSLNFHDNSTAGDASIVNNSILSFSGNSTAGNAAITNTIIVDFSGTSGPLGDNRISAGSIGGSGAFNLGANELTVGGNHDTTVVSGQIFGTGGSLVKTGFGTMTLTGANTYTGGTTIDAGVLQLGGVTAGSLVGAVTVNAAGMFEVVNADTGGITSITNNGFVQFLNATTAGTATIANNSALTFNNASTAGAAVITNNGGLGFADASTAGNAVITNNNVVFFLDASTAGGATIRTTAGAATVFMDNANGGTAQFITDIGGMVDFFGSSGPAGTGHVSAGSIAGGGLYSIGPGNTLTVGSNNLSTEVTGVIANDCGCPGPGDASLIKTGTGALTLSGVNTYTGTTTVNGGALIVNGSIASSSLTTVNAGGLLGGTGIVGSTTVGPGGTLSPGNSIGVLNVSGDLTFQSGATYLVEVDPANADRATVTGTAALAGRVDARFAPGGYVARRYTILSAQGGLGGTRFDALTTTDLPANVAASLSYDAFNAYLDLMLSFSTPGGLNRNQQAVADALTGFFNATGGIPGPFIALSGEQLTQTSGEGGAPVSQSSFMAMNQFFNAMFDPFAQGRPGSAGGASAFAAEPGAQGRAAFAALATKAPAYGLFERRWSVWGAGYGGTAKVDGSATVGSHDTTHRAYGFAAGLDHRLAPDTTVGFALAGGGTSFGLAQGMGSGRSDLFQAGVHARQGIGPAYLAGALAYGWQDVRTERTVTAAGFERLEAAFHAHTLAARAEAGRRFGGAFGGVTPYGALQVISVRLPGYAERARAGAGVFALSYAARTDTQTRSELGARLDHTMALAGGDLTLRGRAAWAHDFGGLRAAQAMFQTLPGASFAVQGARPDRDSLLTSAGAELRFGNGLSVAATFEGEFSRNLAGYAGKGAIRYAW